MKKSTLSIAIIASAFFSSSLLANTPSWNNVEIGYAKADYDDVEPDGFFVKGSTLVTENVFLTAEYTSLSDDVWGVDVDLTWARLGAGYRYSIATSTDLYGKVTYEYTEAEASYAGISDSNDDSGFGLTAGVRSRITSQFEVDGSIGYIDIDGEGDAAFAVSAHYYFNDQFAVGARFLNVDDLDILSASIRYSF